MHRCLRRARPVSLLANVVVTVRLASLVSQEGGESVLEHGLAAVGELAARADPEQVAQLCLREFGIL